MSRLLALPCAVAAVVAVASCAETPAPVPPPLVVTLAPPPASAASAEPAPPAPAAAPATEPPDESPQHKIALTLRPGDPPCTLVMDGGLFSETPDTFVIASVSRIATEASGGGARPACSTISAARKKPRPDAMDPEPLQAGPFLKPGRTMPPDADFPPSRTG